MTQREDLVRWAMAQVGKPYTAYRDCSGFTAAAYRQVGITIPEGSVAQYGVGQPVRDPTLRMGDLLFWDTFGPRPGHVALYVGNEQVVHALNEQRGVVVSQWDANMGGRFMGARRILASADSPIVEDPAPVEETPDPKVKGRNKRHRRHLRREGKL